jgi:hypothetical protein
MQKDMGKTDLNLFNKYEIMVRGLKELNIEYSRFSILLEILGGLINSNISGCNNEGIKSICSEIDLTANYFKFANNANIYLFDEKEKKFEKYENCKITIACDFNKPNDIKLHVLNDGDEIKNSQKPSQITVTNNISTKDCLKLYSAIVPIKIVKTSLESHVIIHYNSKRYYKFDNSYSLKAWGCLDCLTDNCKVTIYIKS